MNVDNTKKLSVVSWFTGYSGNELGLRRVIPGLQPIALCERESFVIANLVSKMEAGLLDSVPIWSDCKTFPIEPFKDRVFLFTGSYPCQSFSHAGKRLGVDDHRHLWPYCRKFIQEARPGLVWLENVEGHVSLGLSTVLADLAEDGYTAAWGIFSASEVGAPHQRKRVFILAYSQGAERLLTGTTRTGRAGFADSGGAEELALGNSIGLPHGEPKEQSAEAGVNAQRDSAASGGEDVAWPSRPGEAQYGWEPPRVVGNAKRLRSESAGNEGTMGEAGVSSSGEGGESAFAAKESGDTGNLNRQTQPPLGGNADGNPPGLDFARHTGLGDTELAEIREWMVKGTNRTDELRMCGNGVVPATAERAFRVLAAELGIKI